MAGLAAEAEMPMKGLGRVSSFRLKTTLRCHLSSPMPPPLLLQGRLQPLLRRLALLLLCALSC